MGFSPIEVDKMTFWQFLAARDGFMLSNGSKRQGRDIDDDQLAEMGIEGF